ncbi:hypothetical protein EZV62_010502 [Acer yangbiense]|uniref:Ubiquitin-like domain-containing protein n=1 Tax=Acer yangbiense TaxID=1000413 RepID=A0A5C7I3C4_9ROSI|nr:hypothetical protein EZV62_010502 [Acer yangbiense]
MWTLVQEKKKGTMAEGQERIELKFRIYDGTDIGHTTYASSNTIAFLKERLITEWPQGKTIAPKSVNDIKLIHAGKILENSKTLADSKVTFGDLPSGVITMHVVVQPHVAKKKTDSFPVPDGKGFMLKMIQGTRIYTLVMYSIPFYHWLALFY